MPAPEAAGSASPTVGESLAKSGANPTTGLNPSQLQERLNNYGPK